MCFTAAEAPTVCTGRQATTVSAAARAPTPSLAAEATTVCTGRQATTVSAAARAPTGSAAGPAVTARPLASAIVTARSRRPSRHLAGTSPVRPSLLTPPGSPRLFVQQAINLYGALGRDAAVDFYSSPESVDGTWYVFLVGEDGVTFAHPNPRFIGRDPSLRVDATGYFYGDDLLSATGQGRWVDYVLENPETGESEQKHTWVVRHDGILFGSGWYEP